MSIFAIQRDSICKPIMYIYVQTIDYTEVVYQYI